MIKKHCNGVQKSGYWKGHPCGASPTIFYNNKWWCKNHFPLKYLEAENKRLREALQFYANGENWDSCVDREELWAREYLKNGDDGQIAREALQY
jgi:hypothetical protein